MPGSGEHSRRAVGFPGSKPGSCCRLDRGQTVIPDEIRRRCKLDPADRLEWILEQGQVRVIPVREDPTAAFRNRGKGGAKTRLLAERQGDREAE